MTEKTQFISYLGNTPKIRVLDMLITGSGLDYSITDIAEQAKIGRATFYRMMENMLKEKVIIPTKKYGNMQLYRLNIENKIVKDLVKLYDHICKTASEKEINRQKKKIKVKIKQ
jgi:hypothetical protein